MYERLGLIKKDGEKMVLTGFGRDAASLEEKVTAERNTIFQNLSERAVNTLVRYQFKNPTDIGSDFKLLPDDCDMRPYYAIWKCMNELDGKLHYEEINRVLLKVIYLKDLDNAVEKIRIARSKFDNNYSKQNAENLIVLLGEEAISDQASARISALFSLAGWGGLIIESVADANGFRNFTPGGKKAVERILSQKLPKFLGTSVDDWYDYYSAPSMIQDNEDSIFLASDYSSSKTLGGFASVLALNCRHSSVRFNLAESLSLRFSVSLLSKRFLILTGLSGSGKTKLAQAFTRWIGPKTMPVDPFEEGAEIKSDRISYYVSKSDNLAVQFDNSLESEKAVAVTLSREQIKEWADYIRSQNLHRTTSCREIREAVSKISKFSTQLHSFETHLKAAAFALIEAEELSEQFRNYELVPVGADWTGNENILGYPHGLEEGKYVTKQALDLIHRASENTDVPHFLILDEMNLSHVERYFADLLSAIESDEPLRLHHDKQRQANGKDVLSEITLPANLFIIGTVNVDETTYMFSPKVLDRANVIEFRMDESDVASFLEHPEKPQLKNLGGLGAHFGKSFVDASKGDALVPEDVKSSYTAEMLLFFKVLQAYGCEYGYRVAHEATRFMKFYHVLGQGKVWDASKDSGKGAWVDATDDGRTWFHDAFDALVVQKFLPKLNGSEAKLRKPLWALAHLCSEWRDWSKYSDEPNRRDRVNELAKVAKDKGDSKSKENDSPTSIADRLVKDSQQPVYPLSFEKIQRMWRAAQTNGFTSFAESI
jgi:energy-coupling factor transporter ATP-binding protein EcfA2